MHFQKDIKRSIKLRREMRQRNAKSAGGFQSTSNYQEHPQVSLQMSANVLKYTRRCQVSSHAKPWGYWFRWSYVQSLRQLSSKNVLTAMPNAEVPWAAGNSPVIAQTFSASSLRYGRIDTTMWPTLVQLKT